MSGGVERLAERVYGAALRLLGTAEGDTAMEMRSTFRQVIERERAVRGRGAVLVRTMAELADLVRSGPVGGRRRGAAAAPTQVMRHAWRSVRRRPAYALAFIGTMALGIGLNGAMVVVVGATALRPLPYRAPDRLAQVWSVETASGRDGPSVPAAEFVAWRQHTDLFEDFEGFGSEATMVLSGGEEPRQIFVSQVTTGLFAQLGAAPFLGRGFEEGVGLPGGAATAVIGHGLWTAAFGADPALVGETIRLDDRDYTVVGVMPPGFAFPHGQAEAWLPVSATPTGLGTAGLTGFVHLRPGLTREEAEARLSARLREASGGSEPARLPAIVDLSLMRTPEVTRHRLILLLGAVGFVLVIATANVLSLGVAEAIRRRRELTIMTTLGAGRRQLLAQLTAEALVLCAAGAAAGLLLARLALSGLVPLIPERLNLNPGGRTLSVWPDGAMLAAGAALLIAPLVGALTAGLARMGGGAPQARTAAGADRTGGRLQHGLITAQVALALVLLAGSGLLLRSVAGLSAADPVVAADRLLLATVRLPRPRYPTPEHRAAIVRGLSDALAGVPGVRSVAVTTSPLPLGRGHFRAQLEPEGGSIVALDDFLPWHEAGPGFFGTLGIRIEAGRALESADGGQPVAVVNDVMARRLWPDGSALGRRFRTADGRPWLTIVGIAEDVPQVGPRDPWGQGMEYYVALPPEAGPAWTFALRTDADPGTLSAAVREAIWSVDPGQPIERVISWRAALGRGIQAERFYATLLTTFAVLAVILAAVGIHAVVSRIVLSRRREIGIRAALGADRWRILRAAAQPGLVAVGIGVGIGIATTLAVTRFLQSLLFGVGARDPLILALDIAVVAAIAALAMVLPARRALAVEPVTAMRSE